VSPEARVGYSLRSRLDKLGVKPGMRVALVGLDDDEFRRELAERTDDVATDRPRRETDMILFRIERGADVKRLKTLQTWIKRNGAIWVLWTKGRKELGEGHVRDAALAAGLVDVKVMAFSATLSGLKLVIPLAKR
jgi:hypothetical protein